MNNYPFDSIFLCLGLIDFSALLVWLGVGLYMAYTDMGEMLERLKNSPVIMSRASFKDAGPAGRLFLMGSVIGVISWPGMYIRDGGASVDDVNSFPLGLKRRLMVWYQVGVGLFTLLLLLWCFGKYAGWVK
ncbi:MULTISPECIES: hypothetical protein [Pseudomonas]|uniref:hypothetical protein n=1 Tax=Pseudomonas TaxID=286 RepID=UPI000F58AE7A|nr:MULTISPECIES: hypothetical protein [Pseudomonas]MBP5070509.1 hypothetical protein [Pseudomonas chlororaphis]MBP5090266.1 hypothetical protein [Pseudomonas chlororaphis]QTT81844.1 hypothetical protein HUT29_11255 [Pseudomonas chlororaphis]